jgi:apolipoprotein N-acyltransferase
MADQLRAGAVDILILPESPSPLSFQYDADYRSSIQQLARRYPLGIVFSNIAFAGEGTGHGYYNSAYFLDREGNERGRYDKIHLVPFGEYVPLKKLFFFVESISKDVSDFQPGTQYVSVPIDDHRVSVVICFEAVFPRLVRQFVNRGAALLINLSNDRWYGDSAAPYQHLAMARWRAVENRRYLLRATNSGISAVIDPVGRVRSRSRLLCEDVCVGRFGFVGGSCFYARYGDVFVFLCVIITACFLLVCLIRASYRVN